MPVVKCEHCKRIVGQKEHQCPSLASPEPRFWSKVDKTESCWLWTASIGTDGYGQFMMPGKNLLRAHRFSYELAHGKVPDGLHLDHLCRVRRCVNPSHLEPVTHKENVLRGNGFAGINTRKTHCVHGHPFSEENTWLRQRAKCVERVCRTCIRERGKARKLKQFLS